MLSIAAGDLITTNYCDEWYPAGPFEVLEVVTGCRCDTNRRLPHWHLKATDLRVGGTAYFNGYVIDRQGRLRDTRRMTHRIGEDEYARIHPEILLVAKAEQGSLF